MRPILLMFPILYLTHHLPFCGARIIAHSYCEHMGIVKLACASIWINAIYGLFVASFLILDVHWLEFLMPTSSMQFSISHLEMFATKP